MVSRTLKKIKEGQRTKVLGSEFYLCPGVFAPLWMDSMILAEVVRKEAKRGESVLDIGTGVGIQAILAAKKGAKVTATDISKKALKCAAQNIERHKLGNRVEILRSDLFSNIKNKFDLIIFNPPFRWFHARNTLERATVDRNYQVLNGFIKEAKKHLNNKGRIIMVWSSSADPAYLQQLMRKYRYRSQVLKKQKRDYGNGYMWENRVYELKPLE